MSTTTYSVPSNFVDSVFKTAGTTLYNFRSIFILLIAIVFIFWILNEITAWIEFRREDQERLADEIESFAKKLHLIGDRRERFEKMITDNSARKAIELQSQFREVLAGGESIDAGLSVRHGKNVRDTESETARISAYEQEMIKKKLIDKG